MTADGDEVASEAEPRANPPRTLDFAAPLVLVGGVIGGIAGFVGTAMMISGPFALVGVIVGATNGTIGGAAAGLAVALGVSRVAIWPLALLFRAMIALVLVAGIATYALFLLRQDSLAPLVAVGGPAVLYAAGLWFVIRNRASPGPAAAPAVRATHPVIVPLIASTVWLAASAVTLVIPFVVLPRLAQVVDGPVDYPRLWAVVQPDLTVRVTIVALACVIGVFLALRLTVVSRPGRAGERIAAALLLAAGLPLAHLTFLSGWMESQLVLELQQEIRGTESFIWIGLLGLTLCLAGAILLARSIIAAARAGHPVPRP